MKNIVTIFIILIAFTSVNAQRQDDPFRPNCVRCALEEKVIHASYYIGYDELHEVPAWTLYELTPQMAGDYNTDVERTNNFTMDPTLSTMSAHPDDYKFSGYDRGHMVPAEDMDYEQRAMNQSFYMSNMCPQLPAFNRGTWRKLESHVRQIGMIDTIWVYTGPIVPCNRMSIIRDTVDSKGRAVIRDTYVSIPTHFWKIVYSSEYNTYTAWVMPNAKIDGDISDYEVSLAALESLAGVNFNLTQRKPVQVSTENALLIQQ